MPHSYPPGLNTNGAGRLRTGRDQASIAPERVAALEFLKSVSDRMFPAGKIWVSDEHAMAFRNGDIRTPIDETLIKLGVEPGPFTPEYKLADELSSVLDITVKYIHHEGYVIEGKESLDVLADAGIQTFKDQGFGTQQQSI